MDELAYLTWISSKDYFSEHKRESKTKQNAFDISTQLVILSK